ncbi:hypothetical protein LY78DRAFT_124182 [Colletotrichum sublineola]|nr:hypothetical protein LY78DRAFT_124182 [Colletotrichum sublineola]
MFHVSNIKLILQWINSIVKHLDAYRRNEADMWKSLQTGPLHARRMRTTCAQVLSHTSVPDIILSMPYIDWDKTSRVKKASSWIVKRIQGSSSNIHSTPAYTGQQWESGDKLAMPQSTTKRKHGMHQKPISQAKPFLPASLLGQMLFEAARLYEKMALLADEQLAQQHLLGNEPLHPRLQLSRICEDSLGSHRKKSPRIHEVDSFRTEIIMVDQVWLRIVDKKTVITSFPQRYGREASDPHSLYRRVRRRLENEAQNVEVTAFNVAVIVLDECIGSFFRQPETDTEAVPFGIVSVSQRLHELSSRTNVLRKKFRVYLAAGSGEPAPALHLELADLQRQIDELVEDLSMISSIMAEQTNCIADFDKMSCSLPRWSRREDEKSSHRLENSMLRSRLESQCQEMKRLSCTAKSLEKTISDIMINEQVRLLSAHVTRDSNRS